MLDLPLGVISRVERIGNASTRGDVSYGLVCKVRTGNIQSNHTCSKKKNLVNVLYLTGTRIFHISTDDAYS